MTPVTALLYRMNHTSLWHRSVRVWGHQLRGTSLDRLLCLGLHRLGLMGAAERRLLERFVRPGMCVVDVGANIGIYSLLLARLVGATGRVIAFEPDPALFQALLGNCRRNGVTNVTPLNVAVGDRAMNAVLYRSAFNTGDNRLTDLGWRGGRIDVEMIPLDQALPDNGVDAVDFMKIDVQGHEMAVLRGMEGVFRKNPRLQLFFELWPSGLRACGTEPAVLLDHLFQRGFRVFTPEGDDFRPVTGFDSIGHRLQGRRYTNLLATRDDAVSVA